MLSVLFDGLELNQSSNRYTIADPQSGVDWGTDQVAGALLTGQYRLEEYDSVAASMNLTRTVTMGIRITSPSSNAMVTDQQAIISRLAGANRFVPKTLTVTPDGSSHVSTFRVYGGSWNAPHDHLAEKNNITVGTLTLICDWAVRGASQALGSSGSPLIVNQPSPAPVTLSPSPIGDVPGDVTMVVNNRDANPIRSLLIAGISQNTTWVAGVTPSGSWTLTGGTTLVSSHINFVTGTTGVVTSIANFAAPTLPSDRRFRLYFRVGAVATGAFMSIRARLVSGSTEVVGPWRTPPPEMPQSSATQQLIDMGSYTFPVGSFGSLGAQGTTIYIDDVAYDTQIPAMNIFEALFLPDDSTLIIETSDTGKTLAANSGLIQVESDQAYNGTGDPVGGVLTGANIRTLGGKYYVYTSKGYLGSLDAALPYAPANVSVWATYVPRYIGLA